MIESLYIHIPFCDHICAYCDFPKVFSHYFDKSLYVKRLIEEIESFSIPEKSLRTIYVGGGTPTSLSVDEWKPLLSCLSRFLPVEEFTIEANPESLTRDKIDLFRQYGVNRISLGVQSCREDVLSAMGRKHTTEDVVRAVKDLHEAGFETISLDFIYGYPGTTKADSLKDIDFALSLAPSHLSFYSLQIEENTLLGKKGTFVDDDSLAETYEAILARLEKDGFHRYEVSNFCRPGKESRHNLTYWHDQEYYGCGMGASGFVSSVRYQNTRSISEYLKGRNVRTKEKVLREDRKTEFLMLNLRLENGFALKDYEDLFHEDFQKAHEKAIQRLDGALCIKDGRAFIRKDLLYIMDSVLLELL